MGQDNLEGGRAISASVPSAGDIVSFLREGCGDFCVNMPGRTRVQPEEIWIPGLGCWLRADGSSALFDMARGWVYYGAFNRWRLRRAIAEFRRLVDRIDALFPSEVPPQAGCAQTPDPKDHPTEGR